MCTWRTASASARLTRSRAGFYKAKPHDGRVVLVLGAGNVNAIPSMDVITKIFNEGKACVLKMNPVNAYLGPFLERAFAEAIREGYLAVVYGGAEEGAYLAGHAGVDEVHLTGSERDVRRDRLGPARPRARGAQARQPPRPHQAGDGRARRRRAGARGAGPVLRQGAGLPGGGRGQRAHIQRLLRLQRQPRGRASPRLGPARASSSAGCRQRFERAADRLAYYPGARERLERFAAGAAPASAGARRARCRGHWSRGSTPMRRRAALPRGVVRPRHRGDQRSAAPIRWSSSSAPCASPTSGSGARSRPDWWSTPGRSRTRPSPPRSSGRSRGSATAR